MKRPRHSRRLATSTEAVRRLAVAALLIIGPFFGVACTRDSKPPLPAPVNVVLITLDTCRADHMSLYGYERETTPNIDAFATHAVVFDRARSQSASTAPALSSLMTSQYVHHHGVLDTFGYVLADEAVTLAERLQAEGLRTAAFTGIGVLMPNRGLAQGFDEYSFTRYNFKEYWKPADRLTDEALAWLETNHDAPFFLWVHYFEPHKPHTGVPDEYLQRFVGEPPEHRLVAAAGLEDGERERVAARIDRYDGALAYVDQHVGRLLRRVGELGVLKNSIVVLSADHGESLGEHGLDGHRFELYEQLVRVPLVVAAPGLQPGRVSQDVEHIDVLPTVLARMELAATGREEGGVLPVTGGSSGEPREVFSETWTPAGHKAMISDGRWKLIFSRGVDDAARFELYDLDDDPDELDERTGAEPARAAELRARLESWMQDRFASPSMIGKGERETEMLRALGYID